MLISANFSPRSMFELYPSNLTTISNDGILDLVKFENIFKLKIVEFTYKISKMNSNVPLIFQNFLKPLSHQYNTRYAAKSRSHG